MFQSPPGPPRRIRLLIAFCDIDGFTAIVRRLGDDLAVFTLMDGYLRAAERLLGDTGRIVKMMGDEFIFVAEEPDAAVRALLAAKPVLEAHLSPTGTGATLRIHAHVGEAVIGSFGPAGLLDVYGEAVNRAATLGAGTRRGGAFILSEEAWRALRPETRESFSEEAPRVLYIARESGAERRPRHAD